MFKFIAANDVQAFVKLPALASATELCDMTRWIQTIAICREAKGGLALATSKAMLFAFC
ncbi:MAG TPA: hypothetical protein VJ280_02225 [Dehalococcoidales bacterium]|nr:hypothetical protein [Dehalococcoidales bacterium]